jgi:hypothetical protein
MRVKPFRQYADRDMHAHLAWTAGRSPGSQPTVLLPHVAAPTRGACERPPPAQAPSRKRQPQLRETTPQDRAAQAATRARSRGSVCGGGAALSAVHAGSLHLQARLDLVERERQRDVCINELARRPAAPAAHRAHTLSRTARRERPRQGSKSRRGQRRQMWRPRTRGQRRHPAKSWTSA